MKLSELMPTSTESGQRMLPVHRITGHLAMCDDRRWGVLIAVSIGGKTFLPTSAQKDLYDKTKHIWIPKEYEWFTWTGLPHACYIILDQPQTNLQRSEVHEITGYLRGPLVDEVIRRSPIPVTANPRHDRSVHVWIRPWVYGRRWPPVAGAERAMAELYRHVVSRSSRLPYGDARYTGGRIVIGGIPDLGQWVRACTEYLYDHLPASSGAKRMKAEWARIVVKHPTTTRNLILTYAANVPVGGEIPDEALERIALAEAAVVHLAWAHRDVLPRDMADFVIRHLDEHFRVPAEDDAS